MNKNMCPVCGLKNIEDMSSSCPQCDADLHCFKVIDSLPDEETVSKKQRIGFDIRIIFIIVSFFLITLFQYKKIYTLEKIFKKSETGFNYQINTINSAIESIRSRNVKRIISAASDIIKSDILEKQNTIHTAPLFFIYTALDSDTLWDIAKQFYNKGSLYPVLIEHNPELYPYKIKKGLKLKILQDISTAEKVYNDTVILADNKKYFNYKFVEGETVEKIAEKFYKNGNKAALIYKANTGKKFVPGERIKVLID